MLATCVCVCARARACRERERERRCGRGLEEPDNGKMPRRTTLPKMTRAYLPQHGTLVMNSQLPAKTKKQSWPSEGILDELRARSKSALAVSYMAPPASASTGAKPASSSRDEARKEKRKDKNVTHCSGPSNSPTPAPLARELEVLLKLEARLELAHGQLANGSGKAGRHHCTSDRTRWNSAAPAPC
jgi:hypothetical protein